MARLRDVPPVIRKVGIWGFAYRVWMQIGDDQLFTWASALAYSWLFAIFPFFIFLMTLLPYLPPDWKESARGLIRTSVDQLPAQAADTVWKNVEQLLNKPPPGFRSIGILLTLWAASGGMAMTMSAL